MPARPPSIRRRRPFAPAVSVVTGAASGIGLALATALAGRGSRVVLADLDEGAAEHAAASLVATGRHAVAAPLDVADTGAVARLVQDVAEREGRLDCLVNNAGVLVNGPFEELDDRHWRRALDVNLGGVVSGSRAAYPVMAAQGSGTIINTGSLAGLMVSPRMLPYTVSKQAVVAFSRGLDLEARSRGIRVHVVCPGFVDTKLLDEPYARTAHAGDFRGYARSLQPRLTSPSTVAEVALAGVEAGRTVIPVGALPHLLWRAERLVPGVADLGSRLTAARQDRLTRGDTR